MEEREYEVELSSFIFIKWDEEATAWKGSIFEAMKRVIESDRGEKHSTGNKAFVSMTKSLATTEGEQHDHTNTNQEGFPSKLSEGKGGA